MVSHVLFGISGPDGRVMPDIHGPLIEAREQFLWSIKDHGADDFVSEDHNVGNAHLTVARFRVAIAAVQYICHFSARRLSARL
jgi:hypothetical protein